MVPLSGNDSPDGRVTLPLTESPFRANVSVGVPPPLGSVTVAFHVPAIVFACAALDCAATGCVMSVMTAASGSNADFIDPPDVGTKIGHVRRGSWIPQA